VDALEDAVLQLVRLGLNGEASSIERFANRLLRRAKPVEEGGDGFRRALSDLLVTHASGRAVSPRDARPVALPAGPADVTYVERVTGATPPILSDQVSAAVERLVRERVNVDALANAGVEPTRSVLLIGPPGVGKTMTAHYIAAQLDVPLVALDLVTVMSSLLGQSGQNIRRAIEYARSTPCVFLLDEVDAIAKRRDDVTDVGELKRIVNLLLLELDRWPSTGLLVAATNHPELLDRAIWRRFDLVLEVDLPDEQMRRKLVADGLARHGEAVSRPLVEFVARATPSASGSDLAMLIRSAVRERVLAKERLEDVLRRESVNYLARTHAQDDEGRALFCRLAHEDLRMTHREIAAMIGVSHVTVGNILKASARPKRPALRTSPTNGGHRGSAR
jgi:SpoVK/Ycf46/Vps4 family AAA+-type ATPase